MRLVSAIILVVSIAFLGCKNNGANTASTDKSAQTKQEMNKPKDIIVGATPKLPKPDFQVVAMNCTGNDLEVVFRYSGGCESHDFNAHFNGAWMKSLPPQAMLEFEHINPQKDACRKLVTDTVVFNATPLQYTGAERVRVIWSGGNGVETTVYSY